MAAAFSAVGSSLFCIGGLEVPNGKKYREQSFNTRRLDTTDPEGGWRAFEMLSPRALPMSIAMDGKLYIFNGVAVEEEASRPWAEVFDPRTESSHLLPSPPSLGLQRRGFFGSVYAALHSSKRILVASPTLNVAYVYNVVDGEWKQLDHNINFKGQVVQDQAAVVRKYHFVLV